MTRQTLLLLFALTLLASFSQLAGAADPAPVVRYSAEQKYEYVRDDLINAINSRGFVIDQISHVGQMLDRTGKDLGTTKKIFGDDQAQTFSFCSAVLSRKTMEADLHNIAFCPYTIVLYSTAAEPKKVYVAYRPPHSPDGSPASKAALKEVEMLLDKISREALNLK